MVKYTAITGVIAAKKGSALQWTFYAASLLVFLGATFVFSMVGEPFSMVETWFSIASREASNGKSSRNHWKWQANLSKNKSQAQKYPANEQHNWSPVGQATFEVDITNVKAVYLTKTKLSWIIDNFETRLKGFFFKEFNKANLIFQNRPI